MLDPVLGFFMKFLASSLNVINLRCIDTEGIRKLRVALSITEKTLVIGKITAAYLPLQDRSV